MQRLSLAGIAFFTVVSCNLSVTRAQPVESASQISSDSQIHLPVVFEKNEGQDLPETRFVGRSGGSIIRFTDGGPDIYPAGLRATPVRFRMLDSNPPESPAGQDELPGKTNYFVGNDASRWHRYIPTFGKVAYKGVAAGIDLVFYGTDRQLEHDFVVAPGADPQKIRFTLAGAKRRTVTPQGDLALSTGSGEILFHKPLAYQQIAGRKVSVDASFQTGRDGAVSFALGKYDPRYELVIDPVLTFSTYLDGSYDDFPFAITTDSAGNIYVAGYTQSPDYPLVSPYLGVCAGCPNPGNNIGYISKLDPTGHTLLYSTYFGGSTGETEVDDIAIDPAGNVVATGYTSSSGFPLAGKFPSSSSAGAYVFSLDATGAKLNHSEILGLVDFAYGAIGTRRFVLAVDDSSNVYVVGTTISVSSPDDIPMTPGTYANSIPAATEALFAVKLASDGSELYGTVIPTSSSANEGFIPQVGGIVLDPQGDLYISATASYIGPAITPGVIGPNWPSTNQFAAFVQALNPTASNLLFSTYLPGTNGAGPLLRAADGTLYIAGTTNETDLPVSTNAYQKTLSAGCSCNSAYVFHIDALGTTVLGATYLSGPIEYNNESTYYNSIALDGSGNVYVGGGTSSTQAPLLNPVTSVLDMTGNPTGEGTVLEGLTPDLSQLVFGSYFNGAGAGSQLTEMTITPANQLVFVGTTFAYNNFPTTSGAVQPNAPSTIPSGAVGYLHQYVASINLTATQDFTIVASGSMSQTVEPNGIATFTFTISPVNGPATPVVALSATGLPTGAQASFTPSPAPAAVGTTNVMLSVYVREQTALKGGGQRPGKGLPWVALCFLAPLIGAFRRVKRRIDCIAMLMLLAGGCWLGMMAGCGGGKAGNSGPPLAGTYNIAVTGSAGTLSHSTNVTLVVQ